MARPAKGPNSRRGVRLARPALIALIVAGMLAVLATLLLQRPAAVTLPPPPARYLDDRAMLLTPSFAAAKDRYIEHLSRTMQIAQINVLILPRVPGGALEEFTIRAATAWKVGAAGADNGLILFVFSEERKLRLEVGYGLEAVITDAIAQRLLAETVVPAFAAGQFDRGIEDFLDVLNRTLEASEAAGHRAVHSPDMLPFVWSVLRSSPRLARQAISHFLTADTGERVVLGFFATVLFAALVQVLVGIAAGVPAMVMLPWRVFFSPTLRGLRPETLREQLAARRLLAAPPSFLVNLCSELELGAIAGSLYYLAGAVIAIAFLSVGSSILFGGLGQFGGGGATLAWPPA